MSEHDTPGRILVSRDGPIATVSLSNPARRNAISVGMWRTLASLARGRRQFFSTTAVMLDRSERSERTSGNQRKACAKHTLLDLISSPSAALFAGSLRRLRD